MTHTLSDDELEQDVDSFLYAIYASGIVSKDVAKERLLALIKAHDQQLIEKILAGIDGLEIDIEATEKHINSLDISEDEKAGALSSAQTDYDDRHDTLNDVRTHIKAIQGEE